MGSVEALLHRAGVSQLDHVMHVERMAFAAKVRAARAVLGLSQVQLAHHIGLTQKSVHRIERGDVQPKARTILAIELFWGRHGIAFENLSNGGFRLVVEGSVLSELSEPDSGIDLSPN
jgi:DNA-binding XRE family transcriptional regulator